MSITRSMDRETPGSMEQEMNAISAENISAMHAAMTQQQVAMAILSKSMDAAKAQGEATVSMLEDAVEFAEEIQPNDGRYIDVTG